MALATGTPLGNVVLQESTYIEGAPYIYFQDYRANPLFNPDAQGFYYGLSGTSTYAVYNLGCVQNVNLTEGLTMNDIRCDNLGVVDTIQKRDYVEFQLEVLSQLPLTVLRHIMKLGSAPSTGTGYETTGIGKIDNAQRYMVYAPAVYDQSAAGWLLFHLHRVKFVDAWTLNMRYGDSWQLTGLKLRAYADTTKPEAQLFGVVKRIDLAALP